MELFNKNHLTSYAFKALSDGTLDDLQTLEVCEHISHCNICAQKLSERDELKEYGKAPRGFSEMTMFAINRLEQEKRNNFIRYCIGVAAGTAAAIALMFSGALDKPIIPTAEPTKILIPKPEKSEFPEPQKFVVPAPKDNDEGFLSQLNQYLTSLGQ